MAGDPKSKTRHRATIAVLIAIAAAVAMPASSSARPLVTGVSGLDSSGDSLRYKRVRGAGAEFVRITLFWQTIAPGAEPVLWDATNPADPNYRWEVADREIRQAVNNGLDPLVQIYGAPRWAQRCRTASETGAPCDPNPADVADFGRAIAARYAGGFLGLPRVRYWQLFNEPNLSLFFNPQRRGGRPVSPTLYRKLINPFAVAVKSARSSNLVVGPGLAPLGTPGNVAPLDFMRRLLCMRGRRNPKPIPGCKQTTTFDVWATNPYTTGGPTHEAIAADDVSLGDLPEMRRLLRAAERAGKINSDLDPVPFWVTEFSWDSRPPDPGGLSWRIHARWAAEAMYRAWGAGVTVFFWYQLRDDDRNGAPYNASVQSGLYLRGATVAQDRPKRVLRAFRFPFVAFRGGRGVRIWGRTPDSDAGPVVIERRAGGGWRRLASVRADGDGIFRRLVRTRYGRGGGGLVRARAGGTNAVPFSLDYVRDFYQPPFG